MQAKSLIVALFASSESSRNEEQTTQAIRSGETVSVPKAQTILSDDRVDDMARNCQRRCCGR